MSFFGLWEQCSFSSHLLGNVVTQAFSPGSIATESCCPFIVTPRAPIFNFLVINPSSKWSCKPGHGIIILTQGAAAAAVIPTVHEITCRSWITLSS